jgi:hypothetical protein
MSHAAQLAQRIVVLHREAGYLRLELPAELCASAAAAAIEQGLLIRAGIVSAAVDRGWQRMSIRYDTTLLSAAQVARQLFALLDGLPAGVAPAAPPAPAASGLQPLLDKLKAALTPAGEAPAGSLQARLQPVIASALTEKAVINFFNDLVAFYLIKAHWDLITKRWLQQPLAHSSAWMTTFYLVFLLVRYRKTNTAP